MKALLEEESQKVAIEDEIEDQVNERSVEILHLGNSETHVLFLLST
jgi:methyl coenzyme M reductase subunit C